MADHTNTSHKGSGASASAYFDDHRTLLASAGVTEDRLEHNFQIRATESIVRSKALRTPLLVAEIPFYDEFYTPPGVFYCTVCNSRARLRCSRCKIMPYCSDACQRAEWPKHKRTCGVRGLKAGQGASSKEKERRANLPIPTPADKVLNAKPLTLEEQEERELFRKNFMRRCTTEFMHESLAAPGGPRPLASMFCDLCHADCGASKLRCGGCRSVAYCGADHQKKDWPKHKAACVRARTQKKEESNDFGTSAMVPELQAPVGSATAFLHGRGPRLLKDLEVDVVFEPLKWKNHRWGMYVVATECESNLVKMKTNVKISRGIPDLTKLEVDYLSLIYTFRTVVSLRNSFVEHGHPVRSTKLWVSTDSKDILADAGTTLTWPLRPHSGLKFFFNLLVGRFFGSSLKLSARPYDRDKDGDEMLEDEGKLLNQAGNVCFDTEQEAYYVAEISNDGRFGALSKSGTEDVANGIRASIGSSPDVPVSLIDFDFVTKFFGPSILEKVKIIEETDLDIDMLCVTRGARLVDEPPIITQVMGVLDVEITLRLKLVSGRDIVNKAADAETAGEEPPQLEAPIKSYKGSGFLVVYNLPTPLHIHAASLTEIKGEGGADSRPLPDQPLPDKYSRRHTNWKALRNTKSA